MRIAIPFFEGMIFQHFGHAPQFKIYEVENKQVVMEMIVEPENRGHDAVAELLRSMDVRVVICGNIGASAIDALDAAGIRAELDLRNEKIGKKIAEGRVQKIPYLLILGDKEAENGQVAVRSRENGDEGAVSVDEFIARALSEIKEMK